jgi:heme O synthase-like polyprenyltransferase
MRVPVFVKLLSLYVATATPLIAAYPVLAASPAGASQVQNFLTNIINIVAGLASTVAAGGLVWSGVTYMMAGGNLQHIDKAKNIFKYSLIGLVLCIAAFVIANLVGGQASSAFGK